MTTGRLFGKKLNANSVLNIIQRMYEKEDLDPGTLDKVAERLSKAAYFGDMPSGNQTLKAYVVNEPVEVAELLWKLNEAIDLLSSLTDSYYRTYIFNMEGCEDTLDKIGVTEEWALDTASKLEKYRSYMYGTCLDWDSLAVNLTRCAAQEAREECKIQHDQINRLRYEDRKTKGKE